MLVVDAFKRTPMPGDVGLEIEVEGSDLPPTNTGSTYWRITKDNSLRGVDNREFVFKKPLSLSYIRDALKELEGLFKEFDSEVDYSHRAGIHCHINVQNLTLRQLVSFLTLYAIYEESFINFCAPSRKGNHFCLSMSDASYLITRIREVLTKGDLRGFVDDDLRYASMNVTSLSKYGSVEFRALESTPDQDKIYNWCAMLISLREYAKTVVNPTDLFAQASGTGPEGFSKQVFGLFYPVIKDQITYETFYNGIRNIQHAIYSIDWTKSDLNIFKKQKNVFLNS
jgi:hypothetical protein